MKISPQQLPDCWFFLIRAIVRDMRRTDHQLLRAAALACVAFMVDKLYTSSDLSIASPQKGG